MFKVEKYEIIEQDPERYLSFPDTIQSVKDPNRLFIVYRSGNSHHPTVSKLVLIVSNDLGETWSTMRLLHTRHDYKCYSFVVPQPPPN